MEEPITSALTFEVCKWSGMDHVPPLVSESLLSRRQFLAVCGWPFTLAYNVALLSSKLFTGTLIML